MLKIIPILALTFSATSLALPTYYSKITNLKNMPQNVSRSSLLGDTEDPNKVWVLPPHFGKAEYKGMTKGGGLGLCPALKTALSSINELEISMREITRKIREKNGELEELNRIVEEKRVELAKHVKNPHILEITMLEQKVSRLDNQINTIIEKLGNEDDPEQIKRLTAELEEFQRRRENVNETLYELKTANREAYVAYTIADQEYKAAQENLLTHNKYLEELYETYNTYQSRVNTRVKRYIKTTGAIASIDYDSKWTREMRKLQEGHPDLNFVRIPTYNARVSSKFMPEMDMESYFEGLPLVLYYNVNGKGHLPYGTRFEQGDPKREGTAVPENVAVDLTLNLIGGCPLVEPGFFKDLGLKVKKDENGIPMFGITTTYDYDVAYKFKVDAKYNLWSFYEKIVKQGTKGGFFSSKSYVHVLESTLSKDKFDFTIYNEGEMSAEEIKAIKEDIKAELMNRVLTTIATPKPREKVNVPKPGTPPETGATKVADGLEKLCGINLYCRVGSWMFRIAGAIWSDKSAETKVRNSWDKTAEESWNTTTMAPQQGIVTYKR